MRVISRKRLKEFWKDHADAEEPLRRWYQVAKKADWRNLGQVRNDFPTADGIALPNGKAVTVFNIGGNKYRLISAIHYNLHKVYILRILTHAEYDQGNWKEQLSHG